MVSKPGAPPASRSDRMHVRRYVRNFQRHTRGRISPTELAAFEALTPGQLDLLLHEAQTHQSAFTTLVRSFRSGCSVLVSSGVSYLGFESKWDVPKSPVPSRVTPSRAIPQR